MRFTKGDFVKDIATGKIGVVEGALGEGELATYSIRFDLFGTPEQRTESEISPHVGAQASSGESAISEPEEES